MQKIYQRSLLWFHHQNRLRPVTFRYKKEYDAGDGHLQYGSLPRKLPRCTPN